MTDSFLREYLFDKFIMRHTMVASDEKYAPLLLNDNRSFHEGVE